MIHILKPHHYKHFSKLGLKIPLGGFLSISDAEYAQHYIEWHHTLPEASKEELHTRVMAHVQTIRQHQHAAQPANHRTELRIIGMLLALLLILLLATRAHGQFSQITTITGTDGATTLTTAGPFKISFSGCTVGGTGAAWTINCTGGAANPGGTAHQLQVNLNGTGFAGISNGTAGQVLCSNGTSSDPAMCDPVVSGPDAPGVAPTKPPVQVGLFDGTNVQRVLGSAAGRLSVDVNSAPTTAVTGTFWQSTQPVSIADGSSVTLGAKADAKSTATDTTAITLMQVLKEISAMAQAPASTPITAAALPLPSGAATAAKQPALGTAGTASADVITVQGKSGMTAVVVDGSGVTQPVSAASLPLPSGAATSAKQPALGTAGTASADVITVQGKASMTPLLVDGSGVTQPVSGTVTVTQATGTNLHTVCDSGCSSSTAPADASAFTESTTSFSPVGGYFRTSPTSLTTDHMGVVGMTATRHLFVNLPDPLPAGTNVIGHVIADSGSTTAVTGTVAVSAASLPLPTGAAADSSLTTLDTDVKSNVTLHAGTNLIGKAGFDNTTPGTTNGVSMAQPTRTTGTITTSSTSIPVTSTGYGVATVTVNGTYAGITVNFEFSDDGGTTYYSDTCTRTDTNVQESSEALPSNQSRAWDCGVFAATNFRVRSSAFTSGTANIGITLSAAPIEPAPTVSVNGTVPVSAASLPLPTGAATSANQCGSSTPCEVSATTSANGATNPIYTRETDGTNPVILDPCRTQANIFKPISQTASAQLVTGTSAKKIYICSINLVTAAANNVAMVEGTGTVCATGIAGMAGGTTAATGWNFAANGGLTQGNGMGSIMAEATNADNLCLLQSAAVQLSGSIGYVVQ